MGTCQICEREIKHKKGLIAHHGYKRPGQGWQTDSCAGAKNLPYEKSRDLIPKVIEFIKIFIRKTENEIQNIKLKNLPVPNILLKDKFIESTNPSYKIRQEEHINRLEYQIKSAIKEKERLIKRYENWNLH
jgi:hypothetical protein